MLKLRTSKREKSSILQGEGAPTPVFTKWPTFYDVTQNILSKVKCDVFQAKTKRDQKSQCCSTSSL
jgi:hypothetical protein